MNFITDRTSGDVARAKELLEKARLKTLTVTEQLEYLAGLKGCYNISDINRVGGLINDIAQLLNTGGYTVNISAKEDYPNGYIMSKSDVESYLAMVTALKTAFYVKSSTPEVPLITQWLDYEGANNIEQILSDVYELVCAMQEAYKPLGTFQLGE